MRLIFFALFYILPTFANNAIKGKTENLVIEELSPYELEINKSAIVFIKDKILKYVVRANKPYIVGQKAGFTYLKVQDQKINVQILKSKDWVTYLNFKRIFESHPNIKLSFNQGQPHISGDILIEKDFSNLLDWLASTKLEPIFDIQFLSVELESLAIEELSRRIKTKVLSLDQKLKVTLSHDGKKVSENLQETYKLKVDDKSYESFRIGVLEIKFISITDSEIKNLSPLLPTDFQWTYNDKIELLSQIVDSSYSDLKLSNKKQSYIKLMMFENEESNYHSGGEFAVQQRSIYRNDLQWKSYGLFINVIPKSFSDHFVSLKMDVKISHLISSDQNIPSLTQESWKQNLTIEMNKPLVVTNTLTDVFSKNKKNHLFIKSIPILKYLFYGSSSDKEDSNVYMIIHLKSKTELEVSKSTQI